jgi:glycosyltransferase involved in cell wall biosynthesis
MSHLSISVVIPAYNAALYLAEAIESVLHQSYPITQILVVDDGSTDGSDLIAQLFNSRIQYTYQPNQGKSAALNLGISMAQGDYLAFLDADDLWTPDKLFLQASFLEANSTVDMVFGYAQQFISPELSDVERARVKVPVNPMPGYLRGAMLVSRGAFKQIGEFSPEHEMTEFIEWYARSQDLKLQMHMLSEVVLQRRVHLSNSCRKTPPQKVFPALLKEILDRRRKLDSSAAASHPADDIDYLN